MPAGYGVLGHVTVRCRADEGVLSLRHESLADVDCSEALLVAALHEKASEVGGDTLVERECRTSQEPRGELWKSTLLTCSATVAMSLDGTGIRRAAALDPLAAEPAPSLEFGSPAEAYRIDVSLEPSAGAGPQRHPRTPDMVSELAVLPPNDVRMGDIVARCREGCDRTAVRYAVRAAAARVGATDVIGISCVTAHSGRTCTGTAARPVADPETNLLAR